MSAKKVIGNIAKVGTIVAGVGATAFGIYTLVTGGDKIVGGVCTGVGAVAAIGGTTATVAGAKKAKKAKLEAAETTEENTEEVEKADGEEVQDQQAS